LLGSENVKSTTMKNVLKFHFQDGVGRTSWFWHNSGQKMKT